VTAARIFVDQIYPRFGAPREMLSDRGTHFTATLMAEVMKLFGVKRRFTTAYHP
jgi:hypothetical protein